MLRLPGPIFYQHDPFLSERSRPDEKETWIEKSKAKEEEKQHAVPKTPRNSIAERRPAAAKKSVKVEEEKATQIEEIEEEAEEVPVAKSEKKKNKGKGKGKGK